VTAWLSRACRGVPEPPGSWCYASALQGSASSRVQVQTLLSRKPTSCAPLTHWHARPPAPTSGPAGLQAPELGVHAQLAAKQQQVKDLMHASGGFGGGTSRVHQDPSLVALRCTTTGTIAWSSPLCARVVPHAPPETRRPARGQAGAAPPRVSVTGSRGCSRAEGVTAAGSQSEDSGAASEEGAPAAPEALSFAPHAAESGERQRSRGRGRGGGAGAGLALGLHARGPLILPLMSATCRTPQPMRSWPLSVTTAYSAPGLAPSSTLCSTQASCATSRQPTQACPQTTRYQIMVNIRPKPTTRACCALFLTSSASASLQ